MTTILIADDLSENRYLLEAIFKGSGYDVVSAQNGSQALELAMQSPPELIVTDILMPVMDGFDLCRQWKTSERLRTVPFIFYTATYTGAKDEQFALSLGAERFVIKPQQPETLMQIVREVLEEARKRQSAISESVLDGETEVLQQHKEALFRKLERKVIQLQAEITERKLAQEALRESRAQLLEAHRLAHIGIWNWYAESDTVTWSEELYQIAGLDSKLPAPRYAELSKIYTAESWTRLNAAVAKAQQTGEPYQLELELVRPDGTRRWTHALGGVKHDDEGHLVGLHGTVQDITDQKISEEKLRLSNLLLLTQLDASIDGILVLDSNHKILHMNRRFVEMWGIPNNASESGTELLVQWILPKLVAPKDVQQRLEALVEYHEAVSREEVKLKDGRTFDRYSAPMIGDGGEYYGRLWSFRDVTEQKRAEEARSKLETQLRVSQKMEAIGILAGGIAHDFNNLLSVILTYTDFVIAGVTGQLKVDLQEVKKASERGAALTRQLLAFSRKQVLHSEPLDLSQVATGVEKMLRRILGEDINLVLALASDLGLTLADPGQIEQVIMNLVVNARDAMPDGGKLTIETANVFLDDQCTSTHPTAKPGPHIMLSVSDSGCGMDKETQVRIFEPFFTTKDKTKGTGLGLSTVYGIVMQSGGSINVHSEPGHGTTFTILLPRVFDAARATPKQRPITKRPPGNETILLVEDEAALRDVGARILVAAGYTVLTASSGDEALQVSEQHEGEINLLVTDVVMPNMSGRTLAENLLKARSELKVLYVSGYTDNAIVRNGVLEPGTHFVSKPFNVADLTRQIRLILDNQVSVQRGT